jgi:hypothetical protein
MKVSKKTKKMFKGGFAGGVKGKVFKIGGMRQAGERLYKKKNWKPDISI